VTRLCSKALKKPRASGAESRDSRDGARKLTRSPASMPEVVIGLAMSYAKKKRCLEGPLSLEHRYQLAFAQGTSR
jgi:hypothetical protein